MMKNIVFYRYLCYSLEIILFFILGCTPNLMPQIFGSSACFLLPIAITIAVFESEIPAMFFGMACGILTDLGFSNSIGTFTIGLTVVCFILGFCANNFITANFLNVMLSAIVISSALISIHFVVVYIVPGYDYASVYFVNHYISRIIQTIVCTIPFYFVNKFVHSTLYEEV